MIMEKLLNVLEKEAQKRILEEVIDKNGLMGTLLLLSEVCGGKACYVREAWQDETLANLWEKASNHIDTCAFMRAVGDVS